jgi:preprotein translocase subunit YajC
MDFIIFPLLMVGMYLLLVRPQQRRLKAQRTLIATVAPGDQVVTAGGLIGTIRVIDGDQVVLEVAPSVELRVLRAAISRVVDPATKEVLDPEQAIERRADGTSDDVATHDDDTTRDDGGTQGSGV